MNDMNPFLMAALNGTPMAPQKFQPSDLLVAGTPKNLITPPSPPAQVQLPDVKSVEITSSPRGPVDPKVSLWEEMIAGLNADRMNRIEGYKGEKQKLEANKPTGFKAMDLTGLVALADDIGGGNFAQSYKAPNKQQEHNMMMKQLEDRIQGEERSLNDDQINFLKQKIAEGKEDNRLKMMFANQNAQAEREAKRLELRQNDDLKKREAALRSKYLSQPTYKTMGDISQAYMALKNNKGLVGPDQQALIMQYTKILDPQSVVRESEYAQSAANAGKINQARMYLKMLSEGTALSPQQVQQMKEVALNLAESARSLLNNQNTLFTDLAIADGLDPKKVVLDPFYGSQAEALAGPSAEDQKAIEWAKANSSTPQAQEILKLHGVK